MTVFTVYSVLYPHKFVSDLLELDLTDIPVDFRIMMLCLAVINFILAFLLEVRNP
jgi:hypothetical protein